MEVSKMVSFYSCLRSWQGILATLLHKIKGEKKKKKAVKIGKTKQ